MSEKPFDFAFERLICLFHMCRHCERNVELTSNEAALFANDYFISQHLKAIIHSFYVNFFGSVKR